jgi:hypothetical protein
VVSLFLSFSLSLALILISTTARTTIMLVKSIIFALVAVSTALALPQSGRPDVPGRPGFPVRPGSPATTATATIGPGNPTTTPALDDGGDATAPIPSEFAFNPPTIKPFFHIDLALSFPVNVTTLDGATPIFQSLEVRSDRLTHPKRVKKNERKLINFIRTGNITGDLNGIILPGVYWENVPPESQGATSVSVFVPPISPLAIGPYHTNAACLPTALRRTFPHEHHGKHDPPLPPRGVISTQMRGCMPSAAWPSSLHSLCHSISRKCGT